MNYTMLKRTAVKAFFEVRNPIRIVLWATVGRIPPPWETNTVKPFCPYLFNFDVGNF